MSGEIGLITRQPEFVPDDDAISEATVAFGALEQLITEHPDDMKAVLAHRTHTEVIAAADGLQEDDTPRAQGIRLLARIFREGYDVQGDFDSPTNQEVSFVRQRGSEQGARMRRVHAFGRRLLAWNEQNPQTATTSPLEDAA